MKKIIFLTLLLFGLGIQMKAQQRVPGEAPAPVLSDYFTPCTAAPAAPNAKGFVQRWT